MTPSKNGKMLKIIKLKKDETHDYKRNKLEFNTSQNRKLVQKCSSVKKCILPTTCLIFETFFQELLILYFAKNINSLFLY